MAKRGQQGSGYSQREHLELFATRVDELCRLRLVQFGIPSRFQISGDALARTVGMKSEEPDPELLRSFLLLFRQFVSNDEPVFVDRVFNVCEQALESDELRGCLREARQAWREHFKGPGRVQIAINGQW